MVGVVEEIVVWYCVVDLFNMMICVIDGEWIVVVCYLSEW